MYLTLKDESLGRTRKELSRSKGIPLVGSYWLQNVHISHLCLLLCPRPPNAPPMSPSMSPPMPPHVPSYVTPMSPP